MKRYFLLPICILSLLNASNYPDTYVGVPVLGIRSIWYNGMKQNNTHPLEVEFYTSCLSPINLNIHIGMHSDAYRLPIEGSDPENTITYLKPDCTVGWNFDLSESVRISPYLHTYSRNFFKGLVFDVYGASIGACLRWSPFIKSVSGETRIISIAPSAEFGYSTKGISYCATLRFEGIFFYPGLGFIFESSYEEIERLQLLNFQILLCWYF